MWGGRRPPLRVPFFCKFQYAWTNVPSERVGDGATLGDELHGGVRIVSLCDEDAGAHGGTAVTSVGAMGIDLAAVTDRFDGSLRAVDEFGDRDREEWTVDGAQPEGRDGLMVGILFGRGGEAHVDDETHAKVAQTFVVVEGRCVADEEVIGDLR